MEENRAVLETRNLGITFGGLKALEGVHFRLHEKEIIGLIGPNGAGTVSYTHLDVYKRQIRSTRAGSAAKLINSPRSC